MSSKPAPTRRQVKAFVDYLIADGAKRDEEALIVEGKKWSNRPTLADFGVTQDDVESETKRQQEGEKREKLWYKAACFLALAIYLVPALLTLAGVFSESLHEAVEKYGRKPSDAVVGTLVWTLLTAPFVTFKWGLIAVLVLPFALWCVVANQERIKGPPSKILKKHEDYLRACKAYEAAERRRNGDFWTSLSGHAFEHELASLLRRAGHNARVTKGSGDDGIDIVSEMGGESVVFQCKRYNGSVGPALVREFYGSLIHHGADRGVIATTGGFTQGAIDFAEDKPIELWTLNEILALQQADGRIGRR